MTNIFKNFDAKKTGIFAGGVLFGTAGIKILASDDAKKFYANCTAAVLRAKSCVMKVVTSVQENAEDILKEEIGQVFVKVLEDAGVYKYNEEGRKAFDRFIAVL